MGTLAKIRRLYFRDKQSIKVICRQTGLSHNTVRSWLREPEMIEPKYPARLLVSKLDAYADTLRLWLKADARQWRQSQDTGGVGSTQAAFIPLKFKPCDALQFD